MPKFKKKATIIIEAEQWFPHRPVFGVIYPAPFLVNARSDQGYIQSLEGGYTVSPGDWIITGVRGEKYACKPDIFEETYELVED